MTWLISYCVQHNGRKADFFNTVSDVHPAQWVLDHPGPSHGGYRYVLLSAIELSAVDLAWTHAKLRLQFLEDA